MRSSPKDRTAITPPPNQHTYTSMKITPDALNGSSSASPPDVCAPHHCHAGPAQKAIPQVFKEVPRLRGLHPRPFFPFARMTAHDDAAEEKRQSSHHAALSSIERMDHLGLLAMTFPPFRPVISFRLTTQRSLPCAHVATRAT